MHIGYAATDDGREDYREEDVHAVSASTRCYGCDGWGHRANECTERELPTLWTKWVRTMLLCLPSVEYG